MIIIVPGSNTKLQLDPASGGIEDMFGPDVEMHEIDMSEAKEMLETLISSSNSLYKNKLTQEDMQHRRAFTQETGTWLKNQCGEFLDKFVICGYDARGNRVWIQHTPKPSDADAMARYIEIAAHTNMVFISGEGR